MDISWTYVHCLQHWHWWRWWRWKMKEIENIAHNNYTSKTLVIYNSWWNTINWEDFNLQIELKDQLTNYSWNRQLFILYMSYISCSCRWHLLLVSASESQCGTAVCQRESSPLIIFSETHATIIYFWLENL